MIPVYDYASYEECCAVMPREHGHVQALAGFGSHAWLR